MKATRRVQYEAKRLLRLFIVNGRLDEERARQVVRRIGEARYRSRGALLEQLRRLVKREAARRAAEVQSAVVLGADMQRTIEARLERSYGPGLETSFEQEPALIGGMRIQVGCDVYDGSVRTALSAFERKL